MEYPKLNPIEAFPVEHEGQRVICLRDPNRVSEKVMLISPETVFIISLFDGINSREEIQAKCEERFGERVPSEEMEQLINQLDDALFLDSKKFKEYNNKIVEDFHSSIIRPSSQAGLSYPEDIGSAVTVVVNYCRITRKLFKLKPYFRSSRSEPYSFSQNFCSF